MVCRKVIKSRTSHYIFSLKAEDLWRKREQRSRLYLGKLREISKNDYVLYDNGVCEAPYDADQLYLEYEAEKLGSKDNYSTEDTIDQMDNAVTKKMERDHLKTTDISLYRKELMAIHFNSKTRPAPNGIRGSEVCIPNTDQIKSIARGEIQAEPKNPKNTQIYNIQKPFERIRTTSRQNDLFSNSCIILHERTSR